MAAYLLVVDPVEVLTLPCCGSGTTAQGCLCCDLPGLATQRAVLVVQAQSLTLMPFPDRFEFLIQKLNLVGIKLATARSAIVFILLCLRCDQLQDERLALRVLPLTIKHLPRHLIWQAVPVLAQL